MAYPNKKKKWLKWAAIAIAAIISLRYIMAHMKPAEKHD